MLTSKVLILILTWSLLLLGNVDVQAQATRKTRSVLFGVRLTKQAKVLLREVEGFFDKQVREEWLDEKDPERGGSSFVDTDGIPVIRVNRMHGRTMDVIIHELFHFKLRARGHPNLLFLYPKDWDTESNRAAVDQLRMQLRDPILHFIFFPQIRALHLDPFIFRKPAEEALRNEAFLQKMDVGAVALFYFKIRLELARPNAMLGRIEMAFARKHNHPGIELGKTLSDIVLQSNPQSPEAEITTFVECLNTFYRGRFRFRERPWTDRKLGKYTEKIAPIEIAAEK